MALLRKLNMTRLTQRENFVFLHEQRVRDDNNADDGFKFCSDLHLCEKHFCQPKIGNGSKSYSKVLSLLSPVTHS